jgi:protein-S-isoprenylcysteine O-methyltransferase Ste14
LAVNSTIPIQPVRQRLRIAALRLSFILLLPLMLFTRSAWSGLMFDILEVAGILAIIAGVLGRFWAILYIGGHKNRRVMDEGPYSICRHPLYLFSTIGVIGFGLMLGSVLMTAMLGTVFFVILSITAAREERFLRASLGEDYDSYSARVPRIIPNLRLFQTSPKITVNIATLRGNLADALVFLSLIPLAVFIDFLHETLSLPALPLW